MEVIRSFYHTRQVSFKFDSTVTDTVVHSFATTDELVNEIQSARIHGGMHFRTSTVDGATLGTQVGKWIVDNHFKPRG